MQHENIMTKMHFEDGSDMTKANIKKLKKETLDFLGRSGWHVGDLMPYYIPWDLIVVPKYQRKRAELSEGRQINDLIANWNDNKFDYVRINYRTDGPYAGLFTVVDGYHRSRALERMKDDLNIEGVLSKIISVDTEEEILLFANQDVCKKRMQWIVKYEAWLASHDETDIWVKTAHLHNNILNKYRLENRIYESKLKYSLKTGLDICKESINENCYVFDCLLDVLKSSGIYNTKDGMSSSMIKGLADVINLVESGRYGDGVTMDDVTTILKKRLKGWTWSQLEYAGSCMFDESVDQAAKTEKRQRIKAPMVDMICKELGLPGCRYYASAIDFVHGKNIKSDDED